MKKRFIFFVILFSLIAFLIIILINYKIDPLGINSKQDYYLNDGSYARYQNIGIAKNNKYETLIVGTSLSENFKTSIVDEVFSTSTIKIPMSGASAKEQNVLVSSVISRNIKKVIWDIHYTAYAGSIDRMHKSHQFPLFLYDKNKLNDLIFYTSFDTLKMSIKKFFFKDKYFVNNFDKLYNWYIVDKNKFNKKNVLKYIDDIKEIVNNSENSNQYTFFNLRSNFEVNILPIIKNNPNITFEFFIPPYTSHYFLGFATNNLLNDIIRFKEYLMENCLEYKNMNLHDFSIDYQTIENLDNYKDTHHFSQNISDRIIRDIKSKKFLVLKNNFMDKNINEYEKYLVNKLEEE